MTESSQDATDEQKPHAPRQILQRPNNSSFLSVLEGGRHVAAPMQQSRLGPNTISTTVGIVDVKCPVSSSSRDVPLMTIKYNPSLSSFLINLDGDVYSFGLGKFVSRRGKNESTMYGKRCNPRTMLCKGASCTYYHDPLKFANNAHTERNMAVSYITEELIKGIATDQDVLSNTSYSTNPFIVEDIVQLAGMLLLKAIAVKSVIRNSPDNSGRPRQSRHRRSNRS